jgi:glutathione S-transferase
LYVAEFDALCSVTALILVSSKDDDGFIMYESRAIGRYLATKSGKFLPSSSDPHTTARFEQAMSIEATNFDPYAFGLVREIILGPTHWGKEIDPVNVDRLTTLLENRLHGHERVLSRQRYLAGDELTIADFYHLPFGMLLLEMGIPFFEDAEKYPNLIR